MSIGFWGGQNVALLGFEVARSPCSYDYVRFRARYTPGQVEAALDPGRFAIVGGEFSSFAGVPRCRRTFASIGPRRAGVT